jgi:hypothetical protein
MNDYVLSAQENLTLVIKSQKYSLFPKVYAWLFTRDDAFTLHSKIMHFERNFSKATAFSHELCMLKRSLLI